MVEPAAVPGPDRPFPVPPERPKGLRGFLMGPRLVDRKGFGFVVAIFLLIVAVFAIAFYGFVTTLQPPPSAPVRFSAAVMVGGNGTFNVSSDGNASWAWTGFDVNLTINNFGDAAVPLPASGQNATFLIGSSTHKDYYHIVWLDLDHNGKVSPGDTFWVTGNGAPLPALSYCHVSLIGRAGGWTAPEYFATSETIV